MWLPWVGPKLFRNLPRTQVHWHCLCRHPSPEHQNLPWALRTSPELAGTVVGNSLRFPTKRNRGGPECDASPTYNENSGSRQWVVPVRSNPSPQRISLVDQCRHQKRLISFHTIFRHLRSQKIPLSLQILHCDPQLVDFRCCRGMDCGTQLVLLRGTNSRLCFFSSSEMRFRNATSSGGSTRIELVCDAAVSSRKRFNLSNPS